MNRGLWASVGAFMIWGLFPLYWYQLRDVPSLQILAHRIVWCTVFVAGYLMIRHGASWLRGVFANPRLIATLAVTSVLISINWGLYIWAVNNGHVVDASLGYFINPLVNVVLGVLVLRERLHVPQWVAIAMAAMGVIWLTWQAGTPPWIALTLALSFGTYGLLRKLAVVESIPGLAVESLFLVLPALGYLLWLEHTGAGSVFGHRSFHHDSLLVLSGILTAIPLVWFAYGARRIPYSQMGIIQYIGPTLQLLTGVFLFGEPFSKTQVLAFGCIWAALAIYAADGWLRWRSRPAPLASDAARVTQASN